MTLSSVQILHLRDARIDKIIRIGNRSSVVFPHRKPQKMSLSEGTNLPGMARLAAASGMG
jgi:hypothetical protein